MNSDAVKAHFDFELMKKARPVEIKIRSSNTWELLTFVAAHAAVEGNFLILLNECFVEAERYNMLSPSFESIEWLDIEEKVSFRSFSYGKEKKEYEKIFYSSPLYRHLKYPVVDGFTYTLRDCCRKCEFHILQEDCRCDPDCPGCPHDEDEVSCTSCGDSCHCPQRPKYEVDEYVLPLSGPCPGECLDGDESCPCPGWAGYIQLEQLQGPCRHFSEMVRRGYC
jgi:hypothetical protein